MNIRHTLSDGHTIRFAHKTSDTKESTDRFTARQSDRVSRQSRKRSG
jgi:hypothetical protein